MPYLINCSLLLRRGLLLASLLWLTVGAAWAQSDSLRQLTKQFERQAQQMPREQLFLHIDRPLYLSGETMWFKVYAVGGAASRPLALSSVAYVEILDAKQQPVLRDKVALQNATGQGTLALPASLASGRYTVRAYTRWMQNYGPEAYFHGTVTVVNTFASSGAIPAPDSAALTAQFFPEGGYLVRGLRSKVAFQVTDRRGRSVAATGTVLDAQGAVVATFATRHGGRGSFMLTPAATGSTAYSAVVIPLPAATTSVSTKATASTSRLPAVRDQGYVLSIVPSLLVGHLKVVVQATADQPDNVLLLVHARQQQALARAIYLTAGRGEFSFKEDLLLDGVSHFTLFSEAHQPLCERLFFRVPRRTLPITARPSQPLYAPRSKVSLTVTAGNNASQPASLSVAVYRLDSLNSVPTISIEHYLGLTSELRGAVADPGYYFTATGPEATAATEDLLLTQGWSRFRWNDEALKRPAALPTFLPELHGPVVRARLTRANSTEPQPGLLTYFSIPGRTVRLYNDQSDANGILQFKPVSLYGPQTVMLQTDPRQDTTSRLTLLDPFSEQFTPFPAPTFILMPRFQTDYARRHLQAQVQTVYAGKKYDRYRTQPIDTIPFYGQPSASYRLDEYTRFKVLEEVLREYVPGVQVRIRKDGFHYQVFNEPTRTFFEQDPLVLLDGVPVANINKIMAIPAIKIRRLDVLTSRYLQGGASYSGLVSFSTYKGDLEGFQLDPRVLIQEYEGLQEQREFYAPRYDTPEQQRSRRPDMRELLYWNPAVTVTSPGAAPQPLEFFTGDQPGRYLIEVQGLDASGAAGSSRSTFEVQPSL
ncbi:MG2 domain-containing protein [Hymenobacter terrestris]|uniref:Macroglobulin domain-containing protein n=1 Tax=Hymenobacter terrestris TaxID=2748310 RepID=A0ABX2Q1G2_9BACT|nr:MG2 domain-containing protein [Hymenobacter terrestris]NVO84768.1 hypothetical protein [Hymenobacter terrestris]